MERLGSQRNLLLFGLASGLIYLLAFAIPYWLPTYYLNVQDEIYQFTDREPWRGVLFYVALAVLFVLYLAAWRLVARGRQKLFSPWLIGLWAALFCLLLIPIQPLTSSDVYGYTFQGRIAAVLGENPFAHFYNEFKTDPFYFCVTFHNLPATSGYGPLWVAIETALGWLARDRLLLNLFLFKGLAAVLHVTSAFLVHGALKRLAPDLRLAGMLFYAWNPLLLYELVGNAHNDAAVAFLVLLAFYLLSRDKGLVAIPCLAAAALVKPVAVLWLPLGAFWLLARQGSWMARIRCAAAVAAWVIVPVVIAYAPFWAGAATFRGVLAQSDIHGNSLPNVLVQILWSLWPEAQDPIVQGVKLLTIVAFVPFYLGQLWASRRHPVRASFDVMLFYLIFVGFQFMPWYVSWLMVPAALMSDRFRHGVALALCVMAPLLYFPFGWRWAERNLPASAVAMFSVLPVAGLYIWLGIRSWQTRRAR